MAIPIILIVVTAVVFALWFSPLGLKAGIWGGDE
jgi:hypothetical protein